MKQLIVLAKYFLVGWICSILISFITALLAYWKLGVSPVLKNAFLCATTGGFGSMPVDDNIWRFIIGIPCIAYAITGWLLLLSLLLLMVIKIIQLLGRTKNTEPAG